MRPWFLAAIVMLFTSGPASARPSASTSIARRRPAKPVSRSTLSSLWYHIVRLGGDALEDGFTAAVYRQTGTPTGWIVSVVSNPFASLTLGSPLTEGRSSLFRPVRMGRMESFCSPPSPVSRLPRSATPSCRSRLTRHPAIRTFSARARTCSIAPHRFFTRICVAGSDAVINRWHSRLCLDLAVQPSSWTGVKSLYQR
jgi:hypothetical protein